jgi:F-type H+-transporting ATPase subunit b
MNARSLHTIGAVVAALLCPLGACAAEGPQPHGSFTALIFYAINFVLFIWVVRRYGGPPISDFFKSRAKSIREVAGRAETARTEARQLASRAGALAAGLAAEKQRLAADLAAETAFQVKQLDALAQETAERIKRDGAISVAAAREAGQRRLRETLAAGASRVALELVRRDFQPSDQQRLLDGFVARLGEETHR